MNLRDLRLRARALFRPNRIERELDDELSFHIERETRKLIGDGLSAEEAGRAARARFGSNSVIADDCRDERGTALIDDAIRDVAYALRSIRRAPLAAVTIVGTVSIGLGVVAVLFTILNTLVFRVDRVPGVNEMYAVDRPLPDGRHARFARRRFEALRTETGVFAGAYAALPGVDFRFEGRAMGVTLVSGDFFDVLRVHPAIGRALTPVDDAPGGRFDRDPAVLGRTLLVGGTPFAIVGVMPAGFRGLDIGGPDAWAPLSQVGVFRPGERPADVEVEIIARLKPGVPRDSARAQLAAWEANQPATAGDTQAKPAPLDLQPRRGSVPQPMQALAIFTPLFVAFGLILLIGCANVANLLLARGVARQREIGIRLSLGASRRRLVRQLMTESLLLALAAAAGGFVVSRVALEGTVYSVMRDLPADMGDVNITVPAADWRVALFLLIAAVASTAFFALMPALQATRLDPVRTLRGELVKDTRPGRARSALVGVQVFASALLLICAAIFLRSAVASARYDPGFRTSDTLLIEVSNESRRAALRQAIAAEPAIIEYAAMRPSMLDTRNALAAIGAATTPVTYKYVSGTYFDVMGTPIVRGRSFAAAEREEHPVVIVSESTARALWPHGDAIGETFRLAPDPASAPAKDEPPLPSRVVTVVGVSRDINGFRFNGNKGAGVFVPTSLEVPHTDVMARITGDPDLARQTLLERFNRVDPNLGMIVTMRTVARLEAWLLSVAFWVAFVLGMLALLLTVSGLFSVVSYLVAQRTREIGVRLALGASSRNVAMLMLAQTARPVLYGLIAGAGLAATLAAVLLSRPLGAFISPIVHLGDPVAYVSSLLVIVVACLVAAALPALRASRVDPMQTLRQE
jgi:predicted permease